MKETFYNQLLEKPYKQLRKGNTGLNNTNDSLSLSNANTEQSKIEKSRQYQTSNYDESNNYSNKNKSMGTYVAPRIINSLINGYNTDINANNIGEWESKHDKRNKMLRGALDIIEHYRLTRPIARAYESVMDNKWLRETTFALKSPKHAIAAIDLVPGSYREYKNPIGNISTNAQMYASKYNNLFNTADRAYKDFYKIKQGENAIRHTIWQAAITSKYGAQIARDAGDAHETRPYFDTNKRVFNSEADADMATDLLNNKIGRLIGVKYKNKSTKEIALRVLEEFRLNGLYTYKQERDGRWYLQKVRLPEKFFYDMYKSYLHLE